MSEGATPSSTTQKSNPVPASGSQFTLEQVPDEQVPVKRMLALEPVVVAVKRPWHVTERWSFASAYAIIVDEVVAVPDSLSRNLSTSISVLVVESNRDGVQCMA